MLTKPRSPDLQPKIVNWTKGQPFTVQVVCSRTRSMFGRELSYFQYEALLLRITFDDGSSRFLTVEIPDGRTNRQMLVTVR